MSRSRYWWIPWFIKATWEPPKYLDLLGPDGRPDHGKIMGYYMLTAFFILILLGKLPSQGHTAILVTCGFGWIAWRAWLKQHTSSSSTTETVLDVHESSEREPGDERDD